MRWRSDIDLGYDDDLVKQAVEGLIKSFPESELQAHTVDRLRGKHALGNVEGANELFEYEEVKAEY